ncbi:membrane protein [Gordonia phage Bradissa]|nr:membrane protein [Gordonia phage Bradissa]
MNTVLDIVFVRTTPTPTTFVVTAILWMLLAAIAASYILRIARWLTDRDLEQIDDDELSDDFVRVDHGVIVPSGSPA